MSERTVYFRQCIFHFWVSLTPPLERYMQSVHNTELSLPPFWSPTCNRHNPEPWGGYYRHAIAMVAKHDEQPGVVELFLFPWRNMCMRMRCIAAQLSFESNWRTDLNPNSIPVGIYFIFINNHIYISCRMACFTLVHSSHAITPTIIHSAFGSFLSKTNTTRQAYNL